MSNGITKQIGVYTYFAPVLVGQGNTKKGIYIDELGNKVFVKLSSDRESMIREFNNQKLFHMLLTECKETTNEESLPIIPMPHNVEIIGDECAFVMEYIPNVIPLPQEGSHNKVDAYLSILNFLSKCNPKKQFLNRLSSRYQYISLPYFLFRNTITYPSRAFLLIKCHIKLMVTGINWLILRTNTLSQGDFNVTNVMLSNNQTVLFDFAEACVTHKYLNLAQAVNSSWYDSSFQKHLWDNILVEFKLNDKEITLLKSFVIFNLTQRLCKRYQNPEQEIAYFSKIESLIKEI